MQKLWWRSCCCAFSPCALLLSIPQTFQINPWKEGKRRRWTFISLCEMYGQNVDISSTETELEVLKAFFFCYLHLGKLEIFFGHKRFAISTVLKKCSCNTHCEFHLKNNEMMGKEKSFNFYGKEKNICLILLMLAHTHHFSISHRRGSLCRAAVLEKTHLVS